MYVIDMLWQDVPSFGNYYKFFHWQGIPSFLSLLAGYIRGQFVNKIYIVLSYQGCCLCWQRVGSREQLKVLRQTAHPAGSV